MNNLGTELTNLAPADRTRLAKSFGLLRLPIGQDRSRASEKAGAGINAVDEMVEGLFRKALELDPTHRWALNNLGLHLHARSRDDEATDVFSRALEVYPGDAEINFNQGVSQKTLGKAQSAAYFFTSALKADPQHAGAALNLAAIHHRYGNVDDAIDHYRKAAEVIDPGDIDMVVMLRNNLGTAFYQKGDHTLAKVEHRAVLALLEANGVVLSQPGGGNEGYDVYIDTLVNLHRARKASCDWHEWERHVSTLKHQVDVRQLGSGRSPSLLPFDTLLVPYPATPSWRRKIAEAHSLRHVEASAALVKPDEPRFDENCAADGSAREEREQDGVGDGDGPSGSSAHTADSYSQRAPLNVGFIGHDFSEHPTAHMMEGVFVWQRKLAGIKDDERQKTTSEALKAGGQGNPGNWTAKHQATPMTAANCCRYSVYSYGGGGPSARRSSSNNGTSSRARESIRASASSFVDMYASGHGESIERIRADGVDILVDLQGHTLGGRGEIAAARPARLQVAYLVFPGTSGAPYMDYLLSDRHVTPPEHAGDYSESLVLLPRTYQANLYEGLVPADALSGATTTGSERAVLRREQGLPGDLSRPVFANFNKIDKLDPESFVLWMKVLRRVPRSVLWLLEPSAADTERGAIRGRLRKEAESQGIDGRRIVWADWVSKSEHLLRHALADLFLDTLTYGAHSTATDALAGGLPFLTLAGASFASRVGVSLVRNAGPLQNTLLVAGQREFEDLAVELVSTEGGRKVLGELRVSLEEGGTSGAHHWQIDRKVSAARGGGRAGHRDRGGLLPIFDTEAITRDLNQAFMLMSDAHDLWKDRDDPGEKRLPHVVLTGRNVGGLDI